MPRGRPKGSKNRLSKGPTRYSIGVGDQYEFPIVREGNVGNPVAMLSVGAGSFSDALHIALKWTLVYSDENGHAFWPLVRYRSSLANEKRYVMGIGDGYAYAESKDAGAWLDMDILEAL